MEVFNIDDINNVSLNDYVISNFFNIDYDETILKGFIFYLESHVDNIFYIYIKDYAFEISYEDDDFNKIYYELYTNLALFNDYFYVFNDISERQQFERHLKIKKLSCELIT